MSYIVKIKEISEKILKDCTVEMVIGFRKGTVPLMNEPCFARTPDQVDQFVWDGNCGINLANYLADRKEKIGIVAKGVIPATSLPTFSKTKSNASNSTLSACRAWE